MKHPATLLLGLCLLVPFGPSAAAEDEQDEGMWSRLKRHDKDGDGRVTRAEFGRGGRIFDRLDTNGDGAITKKEAAAMPARGRMGDGSRRGSVGRGSMGGGGAALAALMLKKLDTDKDGAISKREWATFFEQADENKDAVLQKEEWAAAIGGGSLQDAGPAVGTKVPSVSVKRLDGKEEVNLAAPRRTTVLMFGSWT